MRIDAEVVELVDTLLEGVVGFARGGSSPLRHHLYPCSCL